MTLNKEREDLLESPIFKAYKFTSVISKDYHSPKFQKLYDNIDDAAYEEQAERFIDEN